MEALLADLEAGGRSEEAQLSSLHKLRVSVNEHGYLLVGNHLRRLLQLLHDAILDAHGVDKRRRVAIECLRLLAEVLPAAGSELETQLASLTPALVRLLSDGRTQPSVLGLLERYLHVTQDGAAVFRALLRHGVEQGDACLRKQSVSVIGHLLGRARKEQLEQAVPETRAVMNALLSALAADDAALAAAATHALRQWQNAAGAHFKLHVQRLAAPARELLAAQTGWQPTAASAGATCSPRLTPPHSPPLAAQAQAHTSPTRGVRFAEPDLHAVVEPDLALPGTTALVVAGVGAGAEGSQLVYGFLPLRVLESLTQGDWKVRASAVDELQRLITGLNGRGASVLFGHEGKLLLLLAELLDDANFKITVTTLRIMGDMLNLLRSVLVPAEHLPLFFPTLLSRLGDSKIVIRQQCAAVLCNLIQLLGTDTILPRLIPALEHESRHVREEALKVNDEARVAPRFRMRATRFVFCAQF
eukprot:g770.t1